MASTTVPTFSQVTSAQKRTLIAAALGWGLDGFDVLLYSNIQVFVMSALAIHSKALAGLQCLHAAGVRDWRCLVRLHCRPNRPNQGADDEHSHLLAVLTGFGAFDFHRHADLFPVCAWVGHGRRMEHRRDASRGDVARASARSEERR